MNSRLSAPWALLILCGCTSAPQVLPSQVSFPASASEEIVDSSLVTTPPKALTTVPPAFPRALRVEGLAGKAMIRCVVLKDGRVASLEVMSATDARFGMAAAAAVQRWTFSPAVLNGKRVNCQITIPIEFNVQETSRIDP